VLTHRERLLETLRTGRADRVPLLGGWVLGDRNQQALAGCTEEQYWRDPLYYAIEAHRALDVDGMIAVHVPREPGDYRDGLTKEQFERYKERYHSPEDVRAYVQTLPAPREALAAFDAEHWRGEFRAHVLDMQRRMGDMVYLPTLWEVVHPKFEWYHDFGYENYLMFMHLYPEAADRLFGSEVEVCRRKAEIFVELRSELDLAPMTLVGTDICGGGGPLVAPRALRQFYWPHVRRSLAPLRDAGIRCVWHSDGDFRLIVQDILSAGAAGFQGFQEEYGVDIAALAGDRTLDDRPLTLWAGPSVTTTLPFGSVDEVRHDVERIIDTLAGRCTLFMLPANNILPDCPVDNIVAMHRHVIEYRLPDKEVL
jgi:hypothetical protein